MYIDFSISDGRIHYCLHKFTCMQYVTVMQCCSHRKGRTMKYIKESAIIFGITMIGEFLNKLLPLPVPAGVYGLFLLLLLLCTKVLKLEAIEATGNFLLDTMPIMFIPASVGLIDSYDAMKAILIPLIVTCLISTVVVMGVTGKVTEFMVKFLKKNETNAGEETRA